MWLCLGSSVVLVSEWDDESDFSGTVAGVGRYLALLLVPIYCWNSCVSVYCRIPCREEIKHVSEVIINEHKMAVFVQYLRTVDLSETALEIPC